VVGLAAPLGGAPSVGAHASPACGAADVGRTARVTEAAGEPRGVLLAFHGYSSSAGALAAASGLEQAAAAAGATVVLPQGAGSPARWALADRLAGGDDLALVDDLLDGCDPGLPVVVAGFSNGAAFAAEAACHLGARRVDALVLVGGAGLAAPCPGGRPATVVVVHGGADTVVPVAGGPVLGGTLVAAPLADLEADRVVVVPGWGHTWPAEATAEVLALLP
jgi:polyhydroxybutyrate depolymerase